MYGFEQLTDFLKNVTYLSGSLGNFMIIRITRFNLFNQDYMHSNYIIGMQGMQGQQFLMDTLDSRIPRIPIIYWKMVLKPIAN